METAHVLPAEHPTFRAPPHPAQARTTIDPPTTGYPPRPGPDPTHSDQASTLSERQCRILEFERHWWRYAGAKETAIRAEFGLSATRYYQILNALIDSPAALVVDPMLVRRLRRLRATRRRARTGGVGRPNPAEI
ncbi:DUF3263 domain-containing protein [Frankia sp. Cppng1_Ct_nod]|uniref:DUF3263 domain-containing protein n=1 Tax=Frankia sp. Cppng1_Ct_nod TaxID=2897162 RepID=UPI001F5FE1AE